MSRPTVLVCFPSIPGGGKPNHVRADQRHAGERQHGEGGVQDTEKNQLTHPRRPVFPVHVPAAQRRWGAGHPALQRQRHVGVRRLRGAARLGDSVPAGPRAGGQRGSDQEDGQRQRREGGSKNQTVLY